MQDKDVRPCKKIPSALYVRRADGIVPFGAAFTACSRKFSPDGARPAGRLYRCGIRRSAAVTGFTGEPSKVRFSQRVSDGVSPSSSCSSMLKQVSG